MRLSTERDLQNIILGAMSMLNLREYLKKPSWFFMISLCLGLSRGMQHLKLLNGNTEGLLAWMFWCTKGMNKCKKSLLTKLHEVLEIKVADGATIFVSFV